ncbi:hypothetical protein W911_06305 [Hyphomicrobium nitrativorans NL23]|uniref:Translocation and assembly module TamB C-terminal domain-containing protein n=1 Tax=Hyphomicrobium nitrativorans NL23 TaxID=1029756 RepID=V5SGP0_9HYPH|nr:translocation/assembly module TamB domain-containing protein [Hyphomicrobium nitrativorans]AHB50036.1 hypothetical protein W911_06305 [Hyphomicrobium nitrativorans NL23]
MKKRIVKWLGRFAIAGGLSVLLVAASLATGPGQRSALKIASWAASSSDSAISFGTLEGSLFSNGSIDSIALSDRSGAWLEIRGIAFSWRPLALFSGRLHIENLTADAVDVARPPEQAEKKTDSGSTSLPLIRLVLARFEIGEINIAEAVTGEPLQLHAKADAHLVDPTQGLGAHLAIRRLDRPGGTATVHLTYRPETRDLDVSVAASEPGDGLVARLLELDGATLDLAFEGRGPLDAWRAKWSLAASGTPFVAGNALIDERDGGHDFAAQFEGYLTPLTPHPAVALAAGKTTGLLSGHWTDGRLDIEQAKLTNDALDLQGNGGIDTATTAAFGEVTARIGRADGEPLAFPIEGGEAVTLARADLSVFVPKSATARAVTANIAASDVAHGGRTVGRLSLNASAVQQQADVWRLDDIDMRLAATELHRAPGHEPHNIDIHVTGSAASDRLNLAFATDGLTGTMEGTTSGDTLSLDITAHLPDLARFAEPLAGAATLHTRLRGPADALDIGVSLSAENATLHGHPVANPSAELFGKKSADAFSGKLDARAGIAGQSLVAQSQFATAPNGATTVENLDVSLGDIRLTGDLAVSDNGKPSGRIAIDAPNLTALGAILNETVEGALTASFALSDAPNEPALAFDAQSAAIRYGDMRLKALQAKGRFDELSDDIEGNAELTVAAVTGGIDARNIRLTARGHGQTTDVAITGEANGAGLDMSGTLAPTGTGHDITLSKSTLRKETLTAVLAEPARIALADGEARIGKLAFVVGSGRIDIGGTASAGKLDIAARIASLPASVANAFAPEIGLGGTIDGTIDIAGTSDKPRASAQAIWRNASAASTRNALPPVTVEVTAKLANNRIEGEIETRGPENLVAATQGMLDLSPGGQLTATLSGDIPLALANASLAERAARISGRARLSGNVTGTLDAPSLAAALDIDDATVRDPESGLALKPVTARIRLSERGAVIERLEATSERGGTLSATGNLTLGQDGAPPALAVALDVSALRFDDRRLMAGELDGRFEIRGTPDDLAASGAIKLTRLDVTVPNALPRSISALDIRHVNAPARLQDEARAEKPGGRGGSQVALDIQLNAANRIFVQGRGLDVQLGGALRLGGTAAHPIANGAFSMERGRLAILGRQLDFRRGNINFYGSLEPLLDMEAAAQAGDVTVIVSVTGSSADPKFAFSSVPALPEDEVVARLLYNKDLAGLSPMQLAQLASEIDKIGGLSSGPGVLDQLKASVGVDVLDIGTDSKGAATVSAGSYVNESTYVGVRQGTAAGSSQVVIDHDLTKNLKARGELGADGESKIGIGFEWDY